MRYEILTAGALMTLWGAVIAVAQPSDPAAANRELIGEGPKVNVQQSANATLDVGGPGVVNPKLTGENLRGNLGASGPQPAAGTTPAVPNAGIPIDSFRAPNFGPDLRGRVPGRAPSKQELRVAEDLILPRFRADLGDNTLPAASGRQADGWRYRYFNGRWWYWRSNSTWAYWDGSRWQERAARD